MIAVSPEKLRELAAMPAGQAARWIRENIDPMWGMATGDCTPFKVTMRGEMCRKETFEGSITTDAPDKETAEKFARMVLDQNDPQKLFKWKRTNPFTEDWDEEDWDVVSVSPT